MVSFIKRFVWLWVQNAVNLLQIKKNHPSERPDGIISLRESIIINFLQNDFEDIIFYYHFQSIFFNFV